MSAISPTSINPLSASEIDLQWNSGEKFALAYVELRFECPCAVCVDEKTGVRVIKRESIPADIRVMGAHPVGRYAIQFQWSDRHSTGMYHFENLHALCLKAGRRL